MNGTRRLSICYVVPGHDLLASVGPTRNVLSLARALSRHADVTVAFRRIADADAPPDLRVLEIQPDATAATVDDAATRGVSIVDFLGFMSALHRFVRSELRPFDVVLEKSWLLSGYVSMLCRRRGQLGVPVENIVPKPSQAARRQIMKLLRLHVAGAIAGWSIRRAPLVIAETEFLSKEICSHWKVSPERIAVVDLGVDREMFRPMEQSVARRALGIGADRMVLTYIGVLDYTHNLEPVIRALGAFCNAAIELHVVGDGQRAAEYRRLAGQTRANVVFHGRVPHHEVPTWIAAADACLAPYDTAVFSSGELGYATMKIPEYLSVGRAVVSVPSGRVKTLVRHGETGFLFNNVLDNWMSFLSNIPPRDRFHEMGQAAAATRLQSWDDTAAAYLALCQVRLPPASPERE